MIIQYKGDGDLNYQRLRVRISDGKIEALPDGSSIVFSGFIEGRWDHFYALGSALLLILGSGFVAVFRYRRVY